MSKTRIKDVEPRDGKGGSGFLRKKSRKWRRHLKKQLESETSRIYREDFLPPRSWHNDV